MDASHKLVEIFKNSTSAFTISFSLQLDQSHYSILQQLFETPNRITEINITGQNLDAGKIRMLYPILETKAIKRLILCNNKISGKESLEYLSQGVKAGNIEYLDISNNKITDECVEFLVDLIEFGALQALNLDYNHITKGPIPQALCKCDRIQSFSIKSNPLTYEFVSDLLSALMFNKSLKTLSLSGTKLDGPAPIKENSNGHLSKKEAIILKLAYVLRFSSCTSLAIDLDPSLTVQLGELEKTLIKYNSKLTTLVSENIDWKSAPSQSVLYGIHKALKANTWLALNSQIPKEKQSDPSSDIEELIYTKLNSHSKPDHNESFFSNIEGDYFIEAFKKYPKKNVSHICSVNSSQSSPKFSKQQGNKKLNYPLTYSAETPQFMTAVKGISFSPEGKAEKFQDLDEISSIYYEEKRCTPFKVKEKQLEEMWNCFVSLEKNVNGQVEAWAGRIAAVEEVLARVARNGVEGRLTERTSGEDKGVWSAIGRIEKFMANTSKRLSSLDQRLENCEGEGESKSSKEAFSKIWNSLEDQKQIFNNSLKEKPSKLDLEILEKKMQKLCNKLNFLNSEVEGFRKDLSRSHISNKQFEVLTQEVAKVKERDSFRTNEAFKVIEASQKELMSKYLLMESRFLDSNRNESKERKIEKFNEKVPNYKSESSRPSISPIPRSNIPNLDLPKALKLNNGSFEGISNRIGSTDRSKTPLGEKFLPGEAESLVMSAIIDRANSTRLMHSLGKMNRSPTPGGFKPKLTIEPENIPSVQLQETLRLRGILYDSKGAQTERRK